MPPRRVVFFGSDRFSLPSLQKLVDEGGANGIAVAAVVTQPDRPRGRGRRLTENPVKAAAMGYGIPVLAPERLRDTAAVETLRDWRADVFIVAAYGQILPDSVLGLPEHGCLNVHPSVLPRHRGPSPVASTILAGDRTIGVSIIRLTARMDAGPICALVEFADQPERACWEIELLLADVGAEALLARLPAWLDGDHRADEQDEALATYSRKLGKQIAKLDWNLGAEVLARQVRAFNDWPVAFSVWNGRRIQFLKAHSAKGAAEPGRVVGLEAGSLLIGAGQSLLAVEQLRLEGGRPLAALAAVAGHRMLIGTKLE